MCEIASSSPPTTFRATTRSKNSWPKSASALLTVTDDGRGLPAEPAPSGHHGLRWLAERTEGLGGSFRIADRAPRGVELQVRLPLLAAMTTPAAAAPGLPHEARAA